jgi:hypothetical protein
MDPETIPNEEAKAVHVWFRRYDCADMLNRCIVPVRAAERSSRVTESYVLRVSTEIHKGKLAADDMAR